MNLFGTGGRSSSGRYLSQSDLRLQFGLGTAAIIDQVIVHWPDGRLLNLRNLPADALYTLQESGEPAPDSRTNSPSTALAMPPNSTDPNLKRC